MKILIIEDTPTMAKTYKAYLQPLSDQIEVVASGHHGVDAIRKWMPDVVVTDVNLPDITGIDILKRIKAEKYPVETVVVTSNGSINLAVEAMREGAFDFVVKPMSADRLRTTVRNAAKHQELTRTVEIIKDQFPGDRFCDFIGQSLPMQAVYQILRSAAHSKATVFVTGESGTGKELCATALHKMSARASEPLIALNCAAIPKELLESEVFGHVKGAFTGATQDRLGAALMADGGTLFLDEIGEMEIGFQAKLLRFLETGLVQRVGETTPKPTDVRIVCATNRDPLLEVQEGRFREDLYYRLFVIPVAMPPLRQRDGDILLLARYFLKTFAAEEGKLFDGFSPEAEEAMLQYPWPGNIRELRNMLRQIAVLQTGGRIEVTQLPFASRSKATESANLAAVQPTSSMGASAILPLETQIEHAIEAAIAAANGSIPKAAAALKVSPSTIYRRLQSRVADGSLHP